MPFTDPEKRRACQREYQRRRRGASTRRLSLPALAELRLETARDVIELIKGELATFLASKALPPSERLRGTIGAAGTLLRAFEQVDLVDRLETLESRMEEKQRWVQ